MLVNLPVGQKIILAHTLEVPVCKGFGVFAMWTQERQCIMEAVEKQSKTTYPMTRERSRGGYSKVSFEDILMT